MLSAWAEVLGVGRRYRQPLADVIKIIGQQCLGEWTWPRLNSAIQAVAAKGREPVNAKRLGMWLRARKGRFVGSYRFANDIEQHRILTQWWVEGRQNEEMEGRWNGFGEDMGNGHDGHH